MLRLHYCHGLESGPQGHKVKSLLKWAESVVCPDMEMSLANPLKRNSILRSLGQAMVTSWPSEWASVAFSLSLERCAQAQRDALELTTDVLVGSSWGGAVALKLLADRSYRGPAVLLCPAYRAAEHWVALSEPNICNGRRWPQVLPRSRTISAARAHAGSSQQLWSHSQCRNCPCFAVQQVAALSTETKARCLIVHGTADATIPVDDSRSLSRETGIRLLEVDGGSHGLGAIVRDGRLREYIEAVASGDTSKIQ